MNISLANIAWDNQATRYKGMAKVDIVKLQNIRIDFESLQMKEKEDIGSFMNQVTTVINQLKIYGDDIKD